MDIFNKIILGGNIFGAFMTENETFNFLDKSNEMGIRSIDTSDTYSEGYSEAIIGNYLNTQNREKWYIATKCGLISHGIKEGCNKPDILTNKLEKSLKRLRTSYIDLYQLHHYDPITPFDEIKDVVNKNKKQGFIKNFGLSNYSYKQMKFLFSSLNEDDDKLIHSIQCHLNVFKTDALDKLTPFCNNNNVKVIIYGVLARGILSGKYLNDISKTSRAFSSISIKNDLSNEVIACIEELNNFALKSSNSVIALSIYWSLKQSGIDNVIVGIRGIKQLLNLKELLEVEPTNNIINDFENIVSKYEFNSSETFGAFVNL